MKTRIFRPAGLSLAGLGLLAALGACASSEAAFEVTAPTADTREPVAVVADVEPEEGPRVNQWGGVVPDAKPVTPVDNDALGEVGP